MDLTCEERPSDSPFVQSIWRSRSERGERFISMAESQYSLVVTNHRNRGFVTLRGPSTRAHPLSGLKDTEFFGIQFRPGVFLRDLPAIMVRERNDIRLPEAARGSFWLNSSTWEYPDFENADTFLDRLVREQLLIRDPIVQSILQGQPVDASVRTVRRRFLHAAGLPHGALVQIERARYATMLLKQGAPILDIVYQAGYFDQPHLTRSLKHYIGLTPAQIADQGRREPLSFLYKTTPFTRTMIQTLE